MLLLVLEGIRVDAVVARVHHIVALEAEAGRRPGGELKGLVAAGGGDDGVCGGDGGDDVLDGALREGVRDAGDAKLARAGEGLFVEPGDVGGVVLVELGKGLVPVPSDDVRPLDAVLGLARYRGNGAERDGSARGVHVELALDARCGAGQDDAGLALEALGAAVDERLYPVGVVDLLGNGHEHGVDPAARLDAVQPADDELKLLVEARVKVLDAGVVSGDAHALDALLDEARGNLGLVPAHVGLPEEELSVEVGDVDCVCKSGVLGRAGGG